VWTAQSHPEGVGLGPYVQAIREVDGWICEVTSDAFVARRLDIDLG